MEKLGKCIKDVVFKCNNKMFYSAGCGLLALNEVLQKILI